MTASAKARAQLKAYALALCVEAADKHAEGMNLAQHAARLEQLAELAGEDEILQIRDVFVSEGLLAKLADEVEITSTGGDA